MGAAIGVWTCSIIIWAKARLEALSVCDRSLSLSWAASASGSPVPVCDCSAFLPSAIATMMGGLCSRLGRVTRPSTGRGLLMMSAEVSRLSFVALPTPILELSEEPAWGGRPLFADPSRTSALGLAITRRGEVCATASVPSTVGAGPVVNFKASKATDMSAEFGARLCCEGA